MVPDEVRAAAVAAEPSQDLPPTLAALNYELASGVVCGAGVASLAWLHSLMDEGDDVYASLGGNAGNWWSAMQAPALPENMRNEVVDNWATTRVCTAPHAIWVTAQAGTTRPSYVRNFDRNADALDDRVLSLVHAAMENRLAQLLRRVGLDVIARIKDADLRAELDDMPLAEVAALAARREVRAGKTVLAVTGIEVQRLIDRATQDVAADVSTILESAEAEAIALWSAQFSVALPRPAVDDRIAQAAMTAALEVQNLAESRLAPAEPVMDSQEDLDLGERGNSAVGVGQATAVLLAATGVDAVRAPNGLARTPDGDAAPTVARRPALRRLTETQLAAAGNELAAVRRTAQTELERLQAAADRVEEARRQANVRVRQSQQALRQAAGDQEEALRQSLRNAEAARRNALSELEAAKVQLALRNKELEDEIAAVEAGAGLDTTSSALAEGLAEGRVQFREETMFIHGLSGTPRNPFPPHVNLDKVVVNSQEWEERRLEVYTFETAAGEPRSRAPFSSLGTWFPGDHRGCTCGYRTIMSVEVIDPELAA